MAKLTDMGYKREGGAGEPTAVESKKMLYPSIYIDNKVPDDLMDKDVGQMCRLEVVGKIVSKGINENGDKKRQSMTIDIHKLGYLGKAGKVTREEYDSMSDEDKDEYDKKSVEERE